MEGIEKGIYANQPCLIFGVRVVVMVLEGCDAINIDKLGKLVVNKKL